VRRVEIVSYASVLLVTLAVDVTVHRCMHDMGVVCSILSTYA
jgi:hypothetical protein